METSEHENTTALGVLAASLAARLNLDDLEWLCAELARRAEERRDDKREEGWRP